ncbi:hypothetical protein Q1695_003276 [Nippostrongylus brasiliensis]|nr:hypothetical protein Q1695_003276 [Nippostrongylus brasiliensis]
MTVTTRSGARSSSPADSSSPPSASGAVAPQLEHVDGVPPAEPTDAADYCGRLTAPLDDSLSTLDDAAPLRAKDAKALRDAASRAISQAWSDARSQTSALAKKISEEKRISSTWKQPASPCSRSPPTAATSEWAISKEQLFQLWRNRTLRRAMPFAVYTLQPCYQKLRDVLGSRRLQPTLDAGEEDEWLAHNTIHGFAPQDTTPNPQIYTCAASDVAPRPTQTASAHTELAVRAASTTLILPGTEVLVPCYVASASPSISGPPVLAAHARSRNNDSILIAPAVFFRDRAWLSMTNSSSAAYVVRKDEHLTDAQPLQESDDGTLSEGNRYF